jgi:predicted Zn-dependent protease
MTALAAREFQGLRAVAESADSMGQSVLDPALINRLRRSEAEALLAGGQADAAVDLLISFGDQQEADPQMKRLLIQALSKAGRSDELAELRVLALDIDSRRGRAVALYESGSWSAAQQALDGLWKTYPAQFTFADATRLTLAAYQMGDMDTVRRTATAFPSLTDLPGWEELATGLVEGAPDAALLSTEMMRLSMDNADRVLNTVTEVREGLMDQ